MLDEVATVQLVRTQTEDGVRLDGALQTPIQTNGARQGVVLVHGVGGNFYGSTLLARLAGLLLDLGYVVLRVNTRGHDGVSTASTTQGGRLQGAAYERVDDCRLDIQAWVRYLVDLDCRHVTLLGHSLGAIKIMYAQAQQPQAEVDRLIAVSPPRLSFARFRRGNAAAAFDSSLSTAQQWLAEGKPEMLFLASFPFPLVLSAATYQDKYGPEEKYNFLKWADQIHVPIDFIYGGQELSANNSAFDAIEDDIRQSAWGSTCNVTIIPEANHFYASHPRELSETVRRIMDQNT